MQRVCTWERSTKVSSSVHQVPRWARTTVESWDARDLSGTLPWSLCSLPWPLGSGISQLFSRLPHLREAEVASCEGLVTECKVCDALKQVGLNRSPGLNGLSDGVYLRMLHMFVPILMDMFNHWFAQGAIPGSITKGVITLLKKGGRHVWKDLDYYRPITLLNTELKTLAQVLANHLQLVISDLIWPVQNYAVKRRSIQDNLHLVHEVLGGIKDDTKVALINLDQAKALKRFLMMVLETVGVKPEFCKWISMMNHNLQAVVQVNSKHLEEFTIEQSVQQGCLLSPLLDVLALEPLLCSFRDEKANPALHGVPFAGCLRAKVSAYANNITVFVSHRSEIKAMKKAVERYEKVVKAKINFDKSEGLQLGAWSPPTRNLPLEWQTCPHPRFVVGLGLLMEWNCLEVQAKVKVQLGTWLQRCLTLKNQAEVCAVYIFPLMLYRLFVLPQPWDHQLAQTQPLSKLL